MCTNKSNKSSLQIVVDLYTYESGLKLAALTTPLRNAEFTSVTTLRNNFIDEVYYLFRLYSDPERLPENYVSAFRCDSMPRLATRPIPTRELISGSCPRPLMQFVFASVIDANVLINQYFESGVFGYDLKNSRLVVRFAHEALTF